MSVVDNFIAYFDRWEYFLNPTEWESTLLRRLWLILFPITFPLWFILAIWTATIFILLLSVLALPIDIVKQIWKKR